MRICPCKDCNEHNEDCHVHCKEFIEWDKEKREEQDKILKVKMKEMDYWGRKREAIRKMATKKRVP